MTEEELNQIRDSKRKSAVTWIKGDPTVRGDGIRVNIKIETATTKIDHPPIWAKKGMRKTSLARRRDNREWELLEDRVDIDSEYFVTKRIHESVLVFAQ